MINSVADPARVGAPGLQCADVWLRYGPGLPPVLRGVSLTVMPGEVVGLVGHNGAGKSSLVKVLAGAAHPERGSIALDGERMEGRSLRQAMAAGISCVWQELSVIPTMSVSDNLVLGMPDRARLVASRRLTRTRVAEVVARCHLENIDLGATVGSLPFVDRQRIEIARAMALDARYVLLDEPTAGQRGRGRDELFALIRSAASHGVGVLLVDHHLDEVVDLAHRAVVLRDGMVVGEVAGVELTVARMTALMTGFADANDGLGGGGGTAHSVHGRVTDHSAGSRSGACRLRCSKLWSSTLTATSLELHGGTVYGFYGLEGAGQSELLSIFAGATVPAGGSIEVDGEQVAFRTPADAVRRGIVYLSGDRAQMLVRTLSGSDNLLLGQIASKPLWSLAPTRRQRQRIAAGLVTQLDVRGDWRGSITGLSGGNQQKLVIGRALQRSPAVALLEGPTLGVDVAARAQILEMIKGLAVDNDAAVCLASTDEDEVLDACDEVFVMVGGRLVDRLRVTPSLGKERLRASAVAVSVSAIKRG
ncbi:ATP-binding cassette domain-containing protein [Conexibacter sp. S30A1]|uniref:ATP-binding cassette domain-containing protein n=1 Tax=Conexibacter sp. S30A1 TaxID=2937800 RepID=UPI0035312765